VTDEPLPQNVRALGWVSFFTDLSSELLYPINPTFLRQLGAPPEAIGLIEGSAEATASLLKLGSGALSDKMARRKPLVLLGYGLAALSKPLLGGAGSWPTAFLARLLDRTGKGLRASPRDALIAESCPPEARGRAFGLHRSMDTAGAVSGPLLGWAFLQFYPGALRPLYFLAFIPAALGVLTLALLVREKAREVPGSSGTSGALFSLSGLSAPYKKYLWVVLLFALGNSSDAFLLLRAQEGLGVAAAQLLLLYAAFNVVEASLGYLAGKLSDKIGRRPLIGAGWLVFALVYLGFALASRAWHAWALFLLYGFYYTLTQGSQKALAADLIDPTKKGTQLGAFHFLVGLGALPASLLAGFLYRLNPATPFYLGATTAVLSAVILLSQRGPER
jgi:MFS family permease